MQTPSKKLNPPSPQTNPKPFHHKRNTNKPLIALNAKNLVIASCVFTVNTQI